MSLFHVTKFRVLSIFIRGDVCFLILAIYHGVVCIGVYMDVAHT